MTRKNAVKDRWIGRSLIAGFSCTMMMAFLFCGMWVRHELAHPAIGSKAIPFVAMPIPALQNPTKQPVQQASLIVPKGAARLHAEFNRLGFDLDEVAAGREVPRLYLANLPNDINAMSDQEQRKKVFIQALLPLILVENERIAAQHERIVQIRNAKKTNGLVTTQDLMWLDALAEEYGVEPKNWLELQRRVDIVPPSLAIAQAVAESGWGSSRFARKGNALFGHTTEVGQGMRPHGRESGEGIYDLRRFSTLGEAVGAYIHNLNTHHAYSTMRYTRSQLRVQNKPVDGISLAGTLDGYSERGLDYVKAIRSLIRVNGLDLLDQARLANAENGGSGNF